MRENFYRKCALPGCIQVTALRTCFARDMEPGYSSQGEYHNFWEMALVLEGELTIATDRTVFAVPKDGMVLLSPMEVHWFSNATAQKLRVMVLSFDGELPMNAHQSLYMLSPADVQQCLHLLRLIREGFEMDAISVLAPLPDRPFLCQEVRSRLELLLTGVFSGCSMPHRTVSADYQRIVEYLGAHLSQPLTLTGIAQALNMSVSNLKKVFSKYSDVGVMAYFNRCRISRAITLLAQGVSVKSVSEALGYSSQSAFCTAFKRDTGFPPSRLPQADWPADALQLR